MGDSGEERGKKGERVGNKGRVGDSGEERGKKGERVGNKGRVGDSGEERGKSKSLQWYTTLPSDSSSGSVMSLSSSVCAKRENSI